MAVRTVLMVPKHPLTSVVEPRRRSADIPLMKGD